MLSLFLRQDGRLLRAKYHDMDDMIKSAEANGKRILIGEV